MTRKAHRRKTLRLQSHDYKRGTYYITQVTQNRRPLYGTIVNGRMLLSPAGRMVHDTWHEIPGICPAYNLDEFIVMPNHIHGVVHVDDHIAPDDNTVYHDYRAIRAASGSGHPQRGAPTPTMFDFMHRFKSLTTTRYIQGVRQHGWARFDGRLWQREYYENIVRGAADLGRIRAYIRNNPSNENLLRFGELRYVGNTALLALRKTAFVASRLLSGAAPTEGCRNEGCRNEGCRNEGCRNDDRGTPLWVPPPIETQCVISTFLSPLERNVFRHCRAQGIPTIRVLASAFDESQSLDANQLVVTPFTTGGRTKRPTVNQARAAWCNQYVFEQADDIVIGALNPDGMLALLLADLARDIPLRHA
jgi:putative transposase